MWEAEAGFHPFCSELHAVPPCLWHLPASGTFLALASPCLWHLPASGTSLPLEPPWHWYLSGFSFSLVLESHWCSYLAQEICCKGGIDPEVTFSQLAILYTPGLGNSSEDQEARRKQGLMRGPLGRKGEAGRGGGGEGKPQAQVTCKPSHLGLCGKKKCPLLSSPQSQLLQ